jgi:hypothetical protein
MVVAGIASGSGVSIALFMFAGYDSVVDGRYPDLAVKPFLWPVSCVRRAFTAEYAEIAEKFFVFLCLLGVSAVNITEFLYQLFLRSERCIRLNQGFWLAT